jgi:hypothetical protein
MTNDQTKKICGQIWEEVRKHQPAEAWEILAMVIERFCRETDDGSRDAFIDWLEDQRGRAPQYATIN